jgi:acyl carrier protein phosphodiesterase
MSSGNLGDEDGTDVEEFDSALNNRLIHINHTLDVQEWLGDYAEENCHPMITSILRHTLSKCIRSDCKGYATPRSWTMLSEFIICNYGENASLVSSCL